MVPVPTEVAIPLIDFSLFHEGTPEQRKLIGNQVVAAMKNYGFLYIINHGIPSEKFEEAFSWSKKFFELPLEEKQKCAHPPNGAHHRGWSSVGKEKVVQMVFDKEEIENYVTFQMLKNHLIQEILMQGFAIFGQMKKLFLALETSVKTIL